MPIWQKPMNISHKRTSSATLSAIDYASRLYNSTEGQNLPLTKLYALVQADIQPTSSDTSVASANEKVQFPVGEMETLSVSNDSFEELFRSQIAILNNTIPDTSKGTGSNISGQTCADMWGAAQRGMVYVFVMLCYQIGDWKLSHLDHNLLLSFELNTNSSLRLLLIL